MSAFCSDLVRLLFGAIAGYGIAFLIFARVTPARASIYAALIVAVALALYWLWLDHALHASNRYYMRTVLVIATPLFGVPAALYALNAEGRLTPSFLTRVMAAITRHVSARAIAGAFLLVMLVHAVETARFVSAWTNYKAAVLALATGAASDPVLGDPRFVSSDRIGLALNRLSWFPPVYLCRSDGVRASPAGGRSLIELFLAVLRHRDCRTSLPSAVPRKRRTLVRTYACTHR